MSFPRRRIVLLAAGLALLGALVLVPRPESWTRKSAPPPGHGPGADPTPPEPSPPLKSWAPAVPPRKGERPRPAGNPLDRVARGITASSAGGAAPFVLRDRDASAFFTPKGITLALSGRPAPGAGPSERRTCAVQWGLVGAAEVQPRAEGPMESKVNQYVGDPSTWKSGQPTFSTVVYEEVRPGVDLTVESRPRAVKYTLQARRGADLAGLRFRYQGAQALRVAEDGASVEVDAGVGVVREDGLKCWQEGRVVEAKYVARGADEVEISLGDFDPELPLTVDPVIGWSTYVGGSLSPVADDYGYSIAADSNGNAYVAGYTYCVDLPGAGAGSLSSTLQGTVDGFLVKLGPGGVQWSTYLGGTSSDYAYAVAVDSAGNPIVAGYTISSDFPTTAGAYDRILSSYDAFVMKFSAAGSLAWSTFVGGTNTDYLQALAVDSGDNVYIGGYTYSSNFPIVGGFDATLSTSPDGFVAKLNPAGSALVWSSYLGGNNTDYVQGIAVDAAGAAYVTGYTYSTDFTTAGLDTVIGGTLDAFLTKVKPSGSSLDWSAYLGGASSDYAYGVTVATDGTQEPVVVGYTYSPDFPTKAGAWDLVYNSVETFVTRYKADGTAHVYSTFLGGTNTDYGQAVAAGPAGSVYVTGYTYSSPFPTTAGVYQMLPSVLPDGFVTRLNAAGSLVELSTYLGANSTDYPRSIAVVTGGSSPGVYVGGSTYSTNFPASPAPPLDGMLGGTVDAFATKLPLDLTAVAWSSYVGGSASRGDDYGQAVAVDPSGNAYVTGYTSSFDFPVQVGVLDSSLGGTTDVFVMKVSTSVAGVPSIDWSTYLGGASSDNAYGIAVDSLDFPYVTGNTSSFDFPIQAGPGGTVFDSAQSGTEGFVTCLQPDGTIYYSTFLGGSSSDYGRAVAVDSSFNAYVTGYTFSSNFPTLFPFDGSLSLSADVFVTKLNVVGTGVWSSYLGGNDTDYAYGIAVSDAGTAYLTGYTYSTDFSSSGIDNSIGGTVDAFVARVNTGGTLAWTRYLGGASSDYGQAVAVDPGGNHLYVTGYTFSFDFPVPGAYDGIMTTSPDAYVTKIDPGLGTLVWSTFLGGNSSDYGFALDTDTAGNVYVAGYTYSSDFPTRGAVDPTINGSADAFACKMYASGGPGSLAWSTFLGGSQFDYGYGIAWEPGGAVYVTGVTGSPNFPFVNGLDGTLGGSTDAFLVRLDNANPDPPDFSAAGAGVFRMDGSTPIPVGGWTFEPGIVVKAKLADSDDEPVKLQVEIKRVSIDFTGSPLDENVLFIASGLVDSVPVTLSGSPPAEYHLRARTIDSGGRFSAWVSIGGNNDLPLPADRDVGRDDTLPTVAITTPAVTPFHTPAASIALDGTSADADSGVVSVTWSTSGAVIPNSGVVTPPLASWTIPSISLAPGPNTITVTATDAAGNVGSAVIDVVRDFSPPTVTIDPPAQTILMNNFITLTGTAVDAAPGVLDVVEWVNNQGGSGTAALGMGNTWSASVTGLSPGSNVITVTARDKAGNEDTEMITLVYDDTPPTVAISSPTTGAVTSAPSIAMSGTASDNISLASVTLENLTYGDVSTATVTLGSWTSDSNVLLGVGNNVLQARATDTAGRVSTATVTVFQDLTNPVVAITFPTITPPATVYTTGSPYISLSGTATDNRGVASLTWSRSPAGLPPNASPPDGTLAVPGSTSTTWTTPLIQLHPLPATNTITVTLTDLAGNIHQASVDVQYDTSSPSVTLTFPADNPHVQGAGTITITGAASDNGSVTAMTCTNTTTGTPFAVATSDPLPDASFTWSSLVTLVAGVNDISITASDNIAPTPLTTTVTLTVIYDPTAPVVKIVGPTTADDYYTGIGTITLTGTATDNRAVTSLTAAMGMTAIPVSGVASWTTDPVTLAAGPQTITLTASDAAGNVVTDTINVIYDPTLPDLSITSPTVAAVFYTSASTLSGADALAGNASDAAPGLLSTVTWVNAANGNSGTASGTASWSVASINLAPGANPITVIATDAAGNLRSDTITVYRDTQLPTVTITGPTAGPTYTTNSATVALEGTAADDVEVVDVFWTIGGAMPPGTASGTTSWLVPSVTLSPGNNTITVWAADRVGGLTSPVATLTVHYDPTPPVAAVTNPAGMGTYSTTGTPLAVSGTASDLTGSGPPAVDVAQVVWENLTTGGIGNAALLPGTWSASVPLTSGTNALQFTAYDAAGNSTTVTRTVIYDPAAPFVDITTPTTDLSYTTGTTPAVLGGTATDDVGVVGVGWSTTGAVVPASGSCGFTSPDWSASIPLAPGSNVITITATDGVGRTGTARITIVYDPTPPLVAITNPTAEAAFLTTVSPLSLGGASSDNLEVQSVAWVNETTGDGGPALGTGAWSVASIPLVEGPNVITVTATDSVGNTGSATVTVTYDGTPPTVAITTIDGGPPTDPFPTSTRPLAIGGTAGDNLALTSLTWTNSLGGGGSATPVPDLPATAVTWTAWVYLYPGNNLITFTATDAHGYSTTDSVTIAFTPEDVAPTILITAPSATGSAVSALQRVTVGGTADDNVGIVSVTWINLATGVRGTAALTGGPNPVDWTSDIPLTDGANLIVATAVDDAGNLASASITITYSSPSDAVAPAVTITGPTLLDVWDATASPLLLTMAATDNVGVASVTWVNAATGGDGTAEPLLGDVWVASVALALGANTVTVTARDAAGNTATDVLIVNFVPPPGDSANPVVTITSHPTGTTLAWSASVIDLGGTASDNAAVAAVVWSNAGSALSGSADGTNAWTASLALVPGINVVTVRAYDTSGNTDTDQITILYTPPPPPPERIPGGHCGLLGLDAAAFLALLGLLRPGGRRRPGDPGKGESRR